jgi:2-(S-pantetheinyl)-carbapenam-3-carboxylate methyltransferase
LFSQAVQFLHNGCYTRYIAMHLKRRYGVAFVDFYRRIVADALDRPSTVLGSVLLPLKRQYEGAARDGSVPYTHLVASDHEMVARVSAFGRRRGWMPDQWGWLCIAAEYARFERELEDFVRRLVCCGDEMSDVLRYQADIVLQLDYDPTAGKQCVYEYDFPEYFGGGAELIARPIAIWFRDVAMGATRQYPLEKGNTRRFAKAAIGESYPMVRVRHFQHQLSDAHVTRNVAVAGRPEAPHAMYH